jgi:hypothetical protein
LRISTLRPTRGSNITDDEERAWAAQSWKNSARVRTHRSAHKVFGGRGQPLVHGQRHHPVREPHSGLAVVVPEKELPMRRARTPVLNALQALRIER